MYDKPYIIPVKLSRVVGRYESHLIKDLKVKAAMKDLVNILLKKFRSPNTVFAHMA